MLLSRLLFNWACLIERDAEMLEKGFREQNHNGRLWCYHPVTEACYRCNRQNFKLCYNSSLACFMVL